MSVFPCSRDFVGISPKIGTLCHLHTEVLLLATHSHESSVAFELQKCWEMQLVLTIPHHLIKKRQSTEKLYDWENSDATTMLLRNVIKIVMPRLPNTGVNFRQLSGMNLWKWCLRWWSNILLKSFKDNKPALFLLSLSNQDIKNWYLFIPTTDIWVRLCLGPRSLHWVTRRK